MLIVRRFVFVLAGLVSLSLVSSALAEVTLTDRQVLKRSMRQAKRNMRQARLHARGRGPNATGSQALIDASGLKWFINTDITFNTTSSASAAMSEASYTHAVAATTIGGDPTSSTLNDAFDGYNSVCLSLDNTVAQCATGNANFVFYNQLGPATTECMGTADNRQVVFPTMTTGSLEVTRKVYVPDTDSFARWLTSVKNTGGSPATVTLVTANNLGSDSNTLIVTTSSGDNVVTTADTWVTSMQSYSGFTSSDVRLGHVLQGPGAAVPLAGINFVDGDDNPFWGYTVTIPPGETAGFLDFAVGQPTKAAAAAKAAELVGLPASAQQCLTQAELSTIKNFNVLGLEPAALALVPLGQGVLKEGDTVEVQPSWHNAGAGATAFVTGSATASSGGTIVDGAASYGIVGAGATVSCTAESDCYSLTASGPRPGTHWDVKLTETLSEPASHEWLLHVGDSFTDVPRTSPFFRFVETMLHHSVTVGCGLNAYCPANPVTREQMSVFVLVGKEGSLYSPVACGTPVFSDVPASSPFCRWIEELARRGVTGGCGGGNYCPADPVTREQVSVFLLHTLDPTLSPPACTTPMFGDVPASSPFCRWVEELARRGITSGCGGGNYCPTDAVTREQMAVFISATFGLTLYGP
jgi:hypothetical protein